jgi:hypothetical protein
MRFAATLAHDDQGANAAATTSCRCCGGDVVLVRGGIPSVPWEGGAAHASDGMEAGKIRTFEREVAPERLQAARRSKMAKSERALCGVGWEGA